MHVSDTMHPALVTLGLDASPAPVTFTVNGVRRDAPYKYRSIVVTEHVFKAPAEILTDDGVGAFDYWHIHEGGWPLSSLDAADPNALTNPTLDFGVPEVSSSYTAFFRYARTANKVYLPAVMSTP